MLLNSVLIFQIHSIYTVDVKTELKQHVPQNEQHITNMHVRVHCICIYVCMYVYKVVCMYD